MSSLILVLAASLDYLIGDPKNWLHPVQVMGWLISRFSKWVFSSFSLPWLQRSAGIFLGVGLIGGSAILSWLVVRITTQIHPWLGIVSETIMLASCFAGRSLRLAAEDVLQPLTQDNILLAQQKLSQYVGRDTDKLTPPEILRAILETVAENATDGVTAPLFYALLGASLPGVDAVTLAIAYKAASTLDSMIGYRRQPFTNLGWFSAQLEDRLTWLPCRLTVLTLAMMSGKPREVWRLCRRDAIQDPSPNSGWSECAYAAILNVQLGGTNYYQGVLKQKPLLGEPKEPITIAKIRQALKLNRYCFLLWLMVFLLVSIVVDVSLDIFNRTGLGIF